MAIKIDIEKNRRPGPVTRLEPGQAGNLSISAIAAVEQKGVLRRLHPCLEITNSRRSRTFRDDLPFAQFRTAAEHVHHKNIKVPVVINVGEIHPHGTGGNLSDGRTVDGAQATVAGIEPNSVWRPIIVADVQV